MFISQPPQANQGQNVNLSHYSYAPRSLSLCSAESWSSPLQKVLRGLSEAFTINSNTLEIWPYLTHPTNLPAFPASLLYPSALWFIESSLHKPCQSCPWTWLCSLWLRYLLCLALLRYHLLQESFPYSPCFLPVWFKVCNSPYYLQQLFDPLFSFFLVQLRSKSCISSLPCTLNPKQCLGYTW